MQADDVDVVLEMYRRQARVHLVPGGMTMDEAVAAAQRHLSAGLLSEPRPVGDLPGALRLTIEAETTIQAAVLEPDRRTGLYAACRFETL